VAGWTKLISPGCAGAPRLCGAAGILGNSNGTVNLDFLDPRDTQSNARK